MSERAPEIDSPRPVTVTLVGGHESLDTEAVEAVSDALRAAGRNPGSADWLAADRACDVPVDSAGLGGIEDAVRAALADRPIDVAVQWADARRRKLLVADLESTIIRNEMLDDLGARVGAGEEIAGITAAAMRGELDFAASLRRRVALLAGQPTSLLEEAWAEIAWMPGAATLIATCRAHGIATHLVSGGFHVFADQAGEHLGFDQVDANRLEIVDGRLTGRVIEPVLDRETKRRILNAHRDLLGLTPEAVLAVGDGANDLAMLDAAGLGVAYHAKPAVAAAADARIDHGDLETLLFFLGFRSEAIEQTA